MKKKLLVVALGIVCSSLGAIVGGVVAHAATAPTPEIDRANATLVVQGRLRSAICTGEDSAPYVTYTGTWTGSETQVRPDPTDYPLSGALKVKAIKWTINTNTGRGVLTGRVTLTSLTTAAPVYSGTMILVTQGEPTGGTAAIGRGWIDAAIKLPDETAGAGDDSLIADVELPTLSPSGATGHLGDQSGAPSVPDYSVVTNVAPKALDGIC
jgi:hypothetical protein